MASLLKKIRETEQRSGEGSSAISFLGERVILGVVLTTLMAIVMIVNPAPVGIEEGAPAPRTYRATRAIQYTDEAATEAARQEAYSAVDPIYVRDVQAPAIARSEVSDFFGAIRDARELFSEESTLSAEALRESRVAAVLESYEGPVSEEIVDEAVDLTDADLSVVDTQTRELVTILLNETIVPEALDAAKDQLATSADLLPMSQSQRQVVSLVGQSVLRPTLTLDEEATQAARDDSIEGVEPVIVAKQAGENIVVQGQIVTAQHVELLRVLGVFDNSADWPALVASVALLMGMVFTCGAYLAVYEPEVWGRRRDLLILATLLFSQVLITRVIVWLVPEVSPYLLPYPLVAMLVTVLVSARVGLLAALMSTIAGSLLGLSSGVYVVAVLIVNILATVAMSRLREQVHFFYAGAFVMGATGVVSFGATLASTSAMRDALISGGYGLVGGLLASVLTYGLLPFFEVVFRVTTDRRLLELANPSHPLLRQLMMTAPGTYNHSVLTANLAEAAAEDIGANPLLARVGAYYHDIGKIRRPMFFVENQVGVDNPHDETSPSLSALIITSHVKEGLELAKEHKLPVEIRDIIAQHHGKSLVSFFFNKAVESGVDVDERDFRYGGMLPKTPEAALIMIADGAEAVARTIQKPSVDRMEQVVRRVAKEKLEDGQLDESHLTLADVDVIAKRYAKMLAGVYHKRIEYPENARNGTGKDARLRAAASVAPTKKKRDAGGTTAGDGAKGGPKDGNAPKEGDDARASDEPS